MRKSRNLFTQKDVTKPLVKENCATLKKIMQPLNKKIMQPLHKKKLQTSKNIGRTAKRCPENVRSVVKCVKLLFPKVLRKFQKHTVVTAATVVIIVRKVVQSQFFLLLFFVFFFLALLERGICSQGSVLRFSRCLVSMLLSTSFGRFFLSYMRDF